MQILLTPKRHYYIAIYLVLSKRPCYSSFDLTHL